jgi:hypothetical protein
MLFTGAFSDAHADVDEISFFYRRPLILNLDTRQICHHLHSSRPAQQQSVFQMALPPQLPLLN